jgi:hypothetical protein
VFVGRRHQLHCCASLWRQCAVFGVVAGPMRQWQCAEWVGTLVVHRVPVWVGTICASHGQLHKLHVRGNRVEPDGWIVDAVPAETGSRQCAVHY